MTGVDERGGLAEGWAAFDDTFSWAASYDDDDSLDEPAISVDPSPLPSIAIAVVPKGATTSDGCC